MYKKAIKVTEGNKLRLSTQYNIEPEYVDEMVGYNIIADFGDNAFYEVIADEVLETYYEKTERVNNKSGTLDNEWTEYRRKV